jgi:hypothetical protein
MLKFTTQPELPKLIGSAYQSSSFPPSMSFHMKRPALAVAVLAASISPLSAQSGVTEDCKPAWGRYLAAPGTKAFANGSKQGCGWQIKNETYATSSAIRAKALAQCAEQSGPQGGCRIISQSN